MGGFTGSPAECLDVHRDPDHNRAVVTLAGFPADLVASVVAGTAEAIARIDMGCFAGEHPCIGAVDVAPIVYPEAQSREAGRAAARALAISLASLGLPVFLYGEMASSEERRDRAFFRRGGLARLRLRLEEGSLVPDFGSRTLHPSAGAVLVTARPPLVAFNLDLDTQDASVARRIAARVRESGGGPPGLRAIGVDLRSRGRAQVSLNVERPSDLPLADVVRLVAREAEIVGARIAEAEIVGLVAEAALAGFPNGLEIRGFDPERQILERRLEVLGGSS